MVLGSLVNSLLFLVILVVLGVLFVIGGSLCLLVVDGSFWMVVCGF